VYIYIYIYIYIGLDATDASDSVRQMAVDLDKFCLVIACHCTVMKILNVFYEYTKQGADFVVL